jgi:hypothetical protein
MALFLSMRVYAQKAGQGGRSAARMQLLQLWCADAAAEKPSQAKPKALKRAPYIIQLKYQAVTY